MTAASIASLLGYMLVCSFTPGPGNILALNTTSKYGWKKSRRLIFGICAGYAVVQTMCSTVLYLMDMSFSSALGILRIVGSIYMAWLAFHIFMSRPVKSNDEKKPTFSEGLLLQLVNVKIYFYISSLLSAYFIPNCNSVAELALAGAFAVSLGTAACLTWAFLGTKIQTVYFRHFKAVNAVMGLFLLCCAVSIARG